MKHLLTALTLLFVGVLSASSQETAQKPDLAAFKTIDLSGDLTVELIPAQERKVEISYHGVESSKLAWTVADGVLSMRLKPGATSARDASVDVKIYYTHLATLKAAGGRVALNNPLTGGMMDMELSAGVTLSGEIQVKDLVLKVTGNSAADLSGTVKYYTLMATSKSKVNTRNLEADDTRVTATSGAEVYVGARERLELQSETGASIFYTGTPEILRTTTKIMGVINSIGN